MTDPSQNKFDFDALFIIDVVKKYRKHLIIISAIAVLLGVLFSSPLFIQPKFKSTAIVYPSNLIPYSTESPTEQMLQLFASDDLRDELIRDFNLFEHYKVDSTGSFPMTTLYGMMKENISIDKTKFESVEINVLDTDPHVAKAMADSIISKMHKKARVLQRDKSAEVLIIVENQLRLKKAEMDSMENEIKKLRTDYGILDFEEQVRSFTRVYYTELAAGRAGAGSNRPMDRAMNNMQFKGGNYVSLKEHLWRIRGDYNDLKKQYEQIKTDLKKVLTYSNVITSPVAAEKKSYPVRSLIVLMFLITSLLLSFLVLVIYENNRRVAHNKTV